MKKLIVLILGLVLLACGNAFASVLNMTGQLGVYNSTDSQYGLEVDNSNNFVFSKTSSSIKYPTGNATTNQTLTTANSGQIYIFTGTASNTRFTLPSCVAASIGTDIYLVSNAAVYFGATPQSGDIIQFSSMTSGQTITNSATAAKGDAIELFCGIANSWSIKDKTGTWAQQN